MRTSSKCQKNVKNARAKRAKILFSIVKSANLCGFCCRRRRGCLSSLLTVLGAGQAGCRERLLKYHTTPPSAGEKNQVISVISISLSFKDDSSLCWVSSPPFVFCRSIRRRNETTELNGRWQKLDPSGTKRLRHKPTAYLELYLRAGAGKLRRLLRSFCIGYFHGIGSRQNAFKLHFLASISTGEEA